MNDNVERLDLDKSFIHLQIFLGGGSGSLGVAVFWCCCVFG